MSASLDELSKNLAREHLVETKKTVPDDKIDLVLRKGIYPYDYMVSHDKFDERSLPPKHCFYNRLNESHISNADYDHAQRIWTELRINTLGEYSDFYVRLDVTLLCDVMEQFRKTCMSAYGLDALHSFTAPGLAWQAMMKETKCELQLLTDADMLLMVESGVRGGLTQCVKKYVNANNKHLPNYNRTTESSYLAYFDANNLYGWAMSKPLPSGNFKWVDPDSIGDITLLPEDSDIGYILECDILYPETLHDTHSDLPFLPINEIPPNGKFPKLLTTLNNKTKYVAHYSVIKQALLFGLQLSKIHRALEFTQSCWLKPYIDSNTARRANATTSFDKDFFKLMNNAIFGKTLENKRKNKDVRLVSDAVQMLKLTAKPNFKTSIVINEHLVCVSMRKTKIVMDRPLYVGMSILDISKTHMYDFHYNVMVNKFGRDCISIAYMDTDAFIYKIVTEDLYQHLKPIQHIFDFSDYPFDHHSGLHSNQNKKVLGKFKDETNGIPLVEYVGLMAKMYAIKLAIGEEQMTNEDKSVTKKAKGVKKGYLKKHITFEDYKKCLFDRKVYTAGFNTIRSFNHQLYTVTQQKKSLSSQDDKRCTLPDGVSTLPYGHFSLNTIDD